MPSKRELVDCAISSWYPTFQSVTFKTIILPLPEQFLSWLLADGLTLPEGSMAFPARGQMDEYADEDDYKEWSSEDDEGRSPDAAEAPEFTDLRAALAAAITELGGAVVPKLTWSCPKDAVWMMTGSSLRCSNADEVLLLLKSSDRVAHDVANAIESCSDYIAGSPTAVAAAASDGAPLAESPNGVTDSRLPLQHASLQHVVALRRWYDLKPGREFRCFVRDCRLVGISQRDITQRFPSLAEEAASIQARIEAFHALHIHGHFPQRCYTYDCYVPYGKDASVRLVDFNPAGGTTAPLLFEAEEVWPASGDGAEGQPSRGVRHGGGGQGDEQSVDLLRVITEPAALRPAAAVYGVPFDFVDSSEGSALSVLLEQAQQAGGVWEGLHRQGRGAAGPV